MCWCCLWRPTNYTKIMVGPLSFKGDQLVITKENSKFKEKHGKFWKVRPKGLIGFESSTSFEQNQCPSPFPTDCGTGGGGCKNSELEEDIWMKIAISNVVTFFDSASNYSFVLASCDFTEVEKENRVLVAFLSFLFFFFW